MDISNNLFSDDIEHLSIYPKSLENIKFNNNFINGIFPYLEKHNNLKVLDLRNNSLSGSLDVSKSKIKQ